MNEFLLKFLIILLIAYSLSACSTFNFNDDKDCFWQCSSGQILPDCEWVCVDKEILEDLELLQRGEHGEKTGN